MSSGSVISLKNLTKKYGSFTAVDGLNLEVEGGGVFGLLGPNGAGKSTTIRMMLSLITPNSGEVIIFNKNLRTEREAILRNIGCIIEKPDFYLYLSARKNLELFARLSGIDPTPKQLDEMFELVGLKGRDKDKVSAYSHGMKQRLGLAQALIHEPELIILDEPTTGLDPQGIIDLRNLMLRLKSEHKKTILLSSHILSEIELVADSMAIINKGKVVAQGKVSELLSSEDLIATIEVADMQAAWAALAGSNWKAALLEQKDNFIKLKTSKEQIPALTKFLADKGISYYSFNYRKTLEDYFLKLTNEN